MNLFEDSLAPKTRFDLNFRLGDIPVRVHPFFWIVTAILGYDAGPDDQKLVSSLTLFAGIASDLGDDWAPIVAKADEVLDRARSRGLPRCATTQRFLAADARS